MEQQNQLQKGSIGLWSVIFFVVAAASPLTGVVGGLPIAFMAGNGTGVPGVFLLAGLLLVVFSFGFVAMSRYVVNAGAFYSYIAQGLGVSSGMAGLCVAITAYTAMQLSVTAMFGFFAADFIHAHLGIDLPWWSYSLALQVVVVALGIAKVELGGKILGLLMLLEVGIVLLTDGAIMTQPIHFDFSSFAPSVFTGGNVGIALVFAICSFVGFEATAIYSEECREPEKVVPRATLIAVSLIAVFFALTSWAFVQYSGANIAATAAQNPGMYIYTVAEAVLGHWSTELMSILLVTSLFAASQAFHNTLSRYLFAISRDGLLWSKMAQTHPSFQTPYIASIVQGIFMFSATALFMVFKLDPMADVFSWASVLGSMSILLLQLGVSLAVIVFFLKNRNYQASLWSRMIAPLLAAFGMLLTLITVISNVDVLSGSSSPLIRLLPYLLFGFALTGFFGAQLLRKVNPERYSRIGQIVENLN